MHQLSTMEQNNKIITDETIDFDSIDNANLDSEKKKKSNIRRNTSLERVIDLTKMMIKDTEECLSNINNINKKTEFLAINAQIEANRGADASKGFRVVAESIDVMSTKTKDAVEKMRKETISEMENLVTLIQKQSDNIRGNRLSDLALMTIDIIDRNLYERTADVRWWATDETLADSLLLNNDNSTQKATERLKTILKSYKVYYDLILCDLKGKVIANGRPEKFNIKGRSLSDRIWFQAALKTRNGEEYGFQTVHKSRKSGDSTLTFSCLVHEKGDVNQKPIGVLAAVFDWLGLAQKIIADSELNEYRKKKIRICLVDNSGRILADSDDKVFGQISFPKMNELFTEQKGFRIIDYKGIKQLIAHGYSPGYETYTSGWHCLIIDSLKKKS